jgi:hypothetical protein
MLWRVMWYVCLGCVFFPLHMEVSIILTCLLTMCGTSSYALKQLVVWQAAKGCIKPTTTAPLLLLLYGPLGLRACVDTVCVASSGMLLATVLMFCRVGMNETVVLLCVVH